MTNLRRLAAALAIAVLVAVSAAAVGHAANYRFWGFFQQADGDWAAATVGAAQAVPEHGSVDGWRYAVVGDTATREPRTDLTFDDICPDAETDAGSKIVAVVIDPGTAEDSPDGGEAPSAYGGCAEVSTDATSMDVLASVTEAVDEGGFVCSISGYPQSGCDPNEVPGDAPADTSPTVDVALPDRGTETEPTTAPDDATSGTDGADEDSGSGSTVALIAGIGVVVVLAVSAGIRARRRPPTS